MSLNASTALINQRDAPIKGHTYNDRSLRARAVSRSSKGPFFLLRNSIVRTRLSNSRGHLRRMDDQYPPTMPATVVHDSHRKLAWMKAHAQHTRDPLSRESPDKEKSKKLYETAYVLNILVPALMRPKRQRSIFVKDEELKCMLKDRVGTSHVSELLHDEDMTAELEVEELGLVDAVSMLIAKEERLERAEAMR
jgi:hypothetical protein